MKIARVSDFRNGSWIRRAVEASVVSHHRYVPLPSSPVRPIPVSCLLAIGVRNPRNGSRPGHCRRVTGTRTREGSPNTRGFPSHEEIGELDLGRVDVGIAESSASSEREGQDHE